VRRKPAGEEAADEKADDDGGSAAMAGRRTLDSLGAADSVVDAMDLAAAETDRLTAAATAASGGAKAVAATPNPLMLGLSPAAYVLRAVQVRAASSCIRFAQCPNQPPPACSSVAPLLTSRLRALTVLWKIAGRLEPLIAVNKVMRCDAVARAGGEGGGPGAGAAGAALRGRAAPLRARPVLAA